MQAAKARCPLLEDTRASLAQTQTATLAPVERRVESERMQGTRLVTGGKETMQPLHPRGLLQAKAAPSSAGMLARAPAPSIYLLARLWSA